VAAIVRESAEQFRVRFAEIARKVVRGFRSGAVVELDPFLLARAVSEVMRACAFRTAKGGRLLWNDYRLILARVDFERLRAFQGRLDHDLAEALAGEAAGTQAELVGELRVSVVFDEANELRPGEGVVRVAFMPTAKLPDVKSGELTVRFDAARLRGLMTVAGAVETVIVQDAGVASYRLRWPGGEATLTAGEAIVVGRPHQGAPACFVALTGASPKINKQHVVIEPDAAGMVRIARPPAANPVHVGGAALAAGADLTVAPPVEIVLSRGEIALTLTRE
jgi:hypothetical protein